MATYNQSKDAWPYADEQGEYGKKLNNLTKFVASSRLHDAPSGDFPAATVTPDPAATVRELKEQSTEAALAAIRADHAATHNAPTNARAKVGAIGTDHAATHTTPMDAQARLARVTREITADDRNTQPGVARGSGPESELPNRTSRPAWARRKPVEELRSPT